MREHTPGPWFVVYEVDLVDGKPAEWPFSIDGPTGAVCEFKTNDKKARPLDACLMAAAPNLLEAAGWALEELGRIVGDKGFEVERFDYRLAATRALERAIRQAKGE